MATVFYILKGTNHNSLESSSWRKEQPTWQPDCAIKKNTQNSVGLILSLDAPLPSQSQKFNQVLFNSTVNMKAQSSTKFHHNTILPIDSKSTQQHNQTLPIQHDKQNLHQWIWFSCFEENQRMPMSSKQCHYPYKTLHSHSHRRCDRHGPLAQCCCLC